MMRLNKFIGMCLSVLTLTLCGFTFLPPGHYGTLLIPDVGVGVELYTDDMYDTKGLQSIVDAPNSAAYLYTPLIGETPVIADHKHQGFSKIKTLAPGQFVYIFTDEYIDVYSVNFIDPNGINNGNILFSNGANAHAGEKDALNLYTCNSDWKSVTIVNCIKTVRIDRTTMEIIDENP